MSASFRSHLSKMSRVDWIDQRLRIEYHFGHRPYRRQL